MNEPIKDFLGHELCIGDRCAYIKNERTGSSTVRKILHVGVITDIGKSTITFQDIITLNGEIKVFNGNDIVKLSESKTEFVPVEVVHGEWIYKHRHRGGFERQTEYDEFGNPHTITVDNRYECDEPYCSVCGKLGETFLNYCGNCGAKMDIRQVET